MRSCTVAVNSFGVVVRIEQALFGRNEGERLHRQRLEAGHVNLQIEVAFALGLKFHVARRAHGNSHLGCRKLQLCRRQISAIFRDDLPLQRNVLTHQPYPQIHIVMRATNELPGAMAGVVCSPDPVQPATPS